MEEEEAPVANTTYFSHETQFAVVEVLDAIPNNPPEITNLVEKMFMNEDEGLYLCIQLSLKIRILKDMVQCRRGYPVGSPVHAQLGERVDDLRTK